MKSFAKCFSIFSIGAVVLMDPGFARPLEEIKTYRATPEFEDWIARQSSISEKKMVENFSVSDGARGSIIASPSRSNPDYYFHWIRDASLSAETYFKIFLKKKKPLFSPHDFLLDYIDFSSRNQWTGNPSGPAGNSGLGEPKFLVSGDAFLNSWGRPQSDGPALRALTLMEFAMQLLSQGQGDYVKEKLYDGKLPTRSVIKLDLEYISHHWELPSFDIWEEALGDHFYTRIVQARALQIGADFAEKLGDLGASGWYRLQASKIEEVINEHWMPHVGYFAATRNRIGGIDYKSSELDSSVLLGVLQSHSKSLPRNLIEISDDRVLSTVIHIEEKFKNLYAINKQLTLAGELIGVAIGRYPEDKYCGCNGNQPGNPWFLATLALAEFYFRLGDTWKSDGKIQVSPVSMKFLRRLLKESEWKDLHLNYSPVYATDAIFEILVLRTKEAGDQVLRRVRYHMANDGSMSEQFNRENGFMQSARDLTWSYSSFLRAVSYR